MKTTWRRALLPGYAQRPMRPMRSTLSAPTTSADASRPRRTLSFVVVALGIVVVQVAIIGVAALITDLPV